MLQVKVKAKKFRFTIPIPYTMLNIVLSIVCSTFFRKVMNRWIKEQFKMEKRVFIFPIIDKNTLQPVITELKNYKGLILVDVKAKDGTEVKVRL